MKFKKIRKSITACLAAIIMLIGTSVPMMSISILTGSTQSAWADDTTSTYTVVITDNGHGTTTFVDGDTHAVNTDTLISCVANEGYYIDTIEYQSGTSWVAFPDDRVKPTQYTQSVVFKFTSGNAITWTLRVTYSKLPEGQTEPTDPTPSANDILTIVYHSYLNNTTGSGSYSTIFNTEGTAITNETFKTPETLKQLLEGSGYSGDSFTPGEGNVFQGWSLSENGTVNYAAGSPVTHSLWENATKVLEGQEKELDVYAIWTGPNTNPNALSGKCIIDEQEYTNFSFDTHNYVFDDSSETMTHNVRFSGYPASWTVTHSSSDAPEIVEQNGKTYSTVWIKYTFSKEGQTDQIYTFTWRHEVSNSGTPTNPDEMTLQEALNGATMTVTDPNGQSASVTPAFSYSTANYNASGANLKESARIGFENLKADVTLTMKTPSSNNTTATDGSVTTVRSYPFTLSKGNESKDYVVNYTFTTPAPEPSYDELSSLSFIVDGQTYTAFNPNTLSYELEDNVSHTVDIGTCPTGWTATPQAASNTNESGNGSAKIEWTLTKGSLSRTYSFQWRHTTTPSNPSASYDELDTLTFKVDGAPFTEFSPNVLTYTLPTAASHNVEVDHQPEGWEVHPRAQSSTAIGGGGSATQKFEFTKGDLSREYSFSWAHPVDNPPTSSFDNLTVKLNGSSYTAFNPNTNTDNVPYRVTSIDWAGAPSGTTFTNNKTEQEDGNVKHVTWTWTLKNGDTTKTYSFKWDVENNSGNTPGGNSGSTPGGNSGNTPGGNSGDNSGGNSGNTPGGNSGNTPGGNSGNTPSGNSGSNSGNSGSTPSGNSGDNSGANSGSNSASGNNADSGASSGNANPVDGNYSNAASNTQSSGTNASEMKSTASSSEQVSGGITTQTAQSNQQISATGDRALPFVVGTLAIAGSLFVFTQIIRRRKFK